ncbi:MAG: hypothetical protein F4137_23510 [Acidobacteria bacterium]|nr:hypothetical protein [Acidobacteriota bacterium]
MNENGTCPIWGTPASEMERAPSLSLLDSPRAGGEYWVKKNARVCLGRIDDPKVKARLTSWLVERRRTGEVRPNITVQVIKDAIHRPPLSVHTRADRLLQGVSSELSDIASDFANHQDESDMGLQRRLAHSEALRVNEINYLVSYLEHRGWLERTNLGQRGTARYRLSVAGHARLAELAGTAIDSSKAFVAMWFHSSMNSAWKQAIKPSIEDAGYEAIRIDQKEHLNEIDDEVIAELRRARFVVADFTQGEEGPRGSVYYEAGFAHGRNIPVIFSCREDAVEKLHFDTRQYPHIVWKAKKLNEFRDRLNARIGAAIGDGPRAG